MRKSKEGATCFHVHCTTTVWTCYQRDVASIVKGYHTTKFFVLKCRPLLFSFSKYYDLPIER